jgi:hypothetical protein
MRCVWRGAGEIRLAPGPAWLSTRRDRTRPSRPVVAEIYSLQIRGGEGPLAETMHEHSTVLVRDIGTRRSAIRSLVAVVPFVVRSSVDSRRSMARGAVGGECKVAG